MPALTDVMKKTNDAMTVRRVFGEPIESQGTTVIPVAKVSGGGGAGEGTDAETQAGGQGGGFGLMAKPIGAYVIKDDKVTWRPAVDLMRVLIGTLVVAALAALLAGLRK